VRAKLPEKDKKRMPVILLTAPSASTAYLGGHQGKLWVGSHTSQAAGGSFQFFNYTPSLRKLNPQIFGINLAFERGA
jgi:hypothetical protein